MGGRTADHSIIAVNAIARLGITLADQPCRVFNSDMRLLVKANGLYIYPDAMVVCGKIQFVERRDDTLTNPIVIVKVLSKSTRDYDRGTKFNFYKEIPTLQEYILIESEFARVECYRRAGDKWTIEPLDDLDARVKIESLNCEIPLRQLYHKVGWLA